MPQSLRYFHPRLRSNTPALISRTHTYTDPTCANCLQCFRGAHLHLPQDATFLKSPFWPAKFKQSNFRRSCTCRVRKRPLHCLAGRQSFVSLHGWNELRISLACLQCVSVWTEIGIKKICCADGEKVRTTVHTINELLNTVQFCIWYSTKTYNSLDIPENILKQI